MSNPCFSGSCFAIPKTFIQGLANTGRNPCFSGSCFAIIVKYSFKHLFR